MWQRRNEIFFGFAEWWIHSSVIGPMFFFPASLPPQGVYEGSFSVLGVCGFRAKTCLRLCVRCCDILFVKIVLLLCLVPDKNTRIPSNSFYKYFSGLPRLLGRTHVLHEPEVVFFGIRRPKALLHNNYLTPRRTASNKTGWFISERWFFSGFFVRLWNIRDSQSL